MAEVLRNLEQLPPPNTEFIGLQGRLILKERKYLNPAEKKCPKVENNTVDSFETRDYGIFEKMSIYDRKKYWKEKAPTASVDERIRQWSQAVVTSFTHDDNKEHMQNLGDLFTKCGVNVASFNEAEARKIYDRYFSKVDSEKPDSVKRFVKDVLQTYTDPNKLHDAITHVGWMSNIFGGELSAEVLKHLVTAEAQLRDNPTEFMAKLNEQDDKGVARINRLNKSDDGSEQKERELMVHLFRRGEVLPITHHWDEITEKLKDPTVDKLVIAAGTGTGKTTQVPQMIYEVLEEGEKFVVTQPRRLPADALASRVAEELDTEVGEDIGVMHGENKKIAKNTKGSFRTVGTMLRQITNDPMLLDLQYVMVDEWHERQADTDTLVALLLNAQQLRKDALARGETEINGKKVKPLKLLVTSATLDKKLLMDYLKDANIIEVPGVSHPITELYEPSGTPRIELKNTPAKAAKYAMEMMTPGRNLIIFMPGDRLIGETIAELEKEVQGRGITNVKIRALAGKMSKEEQDDAQKIDPNVVSIIVATPVAETSLTIPRVDVISSGYVNLKVAYADTGLEYLEEREHSYKGIWQQRGRTGRESPGTFRFLGTQEQLKERPDHHPAEITRTELSSNILLLKKVGIEFEDLDLIEKPDPRLVSRGVEKLKRLGLLKADGTLSDIGQEVVVYPVDANIKRALYEAKRNNCVEGVTTIAAMLGTTLVKRTTNPKDRDMVREYIKNTFHIDGSDFLTYLNIWTKYQAQPEASRDAWAEANNLRPEGLLLVEKKLKKLLDDLKITATDVQGGDYSERIEKCFVKGYRDILLHKNGGMPPTYTWEPENVVRNAAISRESAVQNGAEKYVVSTGNNPRQTGDRRMIYFQNCQRVKPEWLAEAA